MELNCNYETFTFTYEGIEVEAEVAVAQINGDINIEVEDYFPQTHKIPDSVIEKEYYIYKSTQMEVFNQLWDM